MKSFVVDNMSTGADPLYDCAVDSSPIVLKRGEMVRAKKQSPHRYMVPLVEINEKSLNQVVNALKYMREKEIWRDNVVLCLRNNEMGLTCHNPRLTEKKD